MQEQIFSSYKSAIKEADKRIPVMIQMVNSFPAKFINVHIALRSSIQRYQQLISQVAAATNNSNVGAPECIAGIEKAISKLQKALAVTNGQGASAHGASHGASAAGGGGGGSANMIHVGAFINKTRSELRREASEIRRIADGYRQAAEAAAGMGQTEDTEIFRQKTYEAANQVEALAVSIESYEKTLAMAFTLYHQLQEEAIARAMSIG